jgi:hypothetical protein
VVKNPREAHSITVVAIIIMEQITVMAKTMDTLETITTMGTIVLVKDTANDPDSTINSRRAIDSALTAVFPLSNDSNKTTTRI